MTATTTPRLSLYKTSSDGSDLVNVVTDLLNNWDAIDLAMGSRIVTSSTRPSTPYGGQHILESDNAYRSYVHNGTSPASAGWVEYPNNSATYGGQVWASRATDATTLRVANTFGGGNTTPSILTEHAASTAVSYGGRVSGDTFDRFRVRADGRIDIGSGALARDTNLYRAAADTLKTDDSFVVGATLAVTGAATIGGALAVTGNGTVGGTFGVTGNFTGAANVNTGAWTSYTPVWASSGTAVSIGNGTRVGSYCLVGKMCTAQLVITMGSTTTYGTGTYTYSLPFTSANTSGRAWIGSAVAIHTGVAVYVGTVYVGANSTTAIVYTPTGSGGSSPSQWAQTNPFTWASGDSATLEITFEIA